MSLLLGISWETDEPDKEPKENGNPKVNYLNIDKVASMDECEQGFDPPVLPADHMFFPKDEVWKQLPDLPNYLKEEYPE